MRKLIFQGLFFSLILVASSCKKETKACMDISAGQASVGQDVIFKTCSENALSYDWYFIGPVGAPENSLGSSEIEFTHAFTVPGTYTVGHVAFEKFSFLGVADTITESLIIN